MYFTWIYRVAHEAREVHQRAAKRDQPDLHRVLRLVRRVAGREAEPAVIVLI